MTLYVALKDETTFDPVRCHRAGGYMVGPKGHERKFASYARAVEALGKMDEPRWRRRNTAGNWGIVIGRRLSG
jgi:hypothetical protein